MARSRVHLSLDEKTMERLQAVGAVMMLPPGRVVDQLALEALRKIDAEWEKRSQTECPPKRIIFSAPMVRAYGK